MSDAVAERSSVAQRLLAALARNEFILYRQLILPLEAGAEALAFHEVLIRFREEEDKLLPPGMFLPVLEKYGVMRLLDRWVVGRVTRSLREALQQPEQSASRVSINLSADTLYDERFAPHVRDSLRGAELPVATVSFEITQDTALAHTAALAGLLEDLRPDGCRFVVARFDGSERAHRLLDALRPEFIKISPQLVKVVQHRPCETGDLVTIARTCRAIGVRTIAEHVETPELLGQLRDIGIDFAQGLGIEPPRPLA